MLVIFHYSCSSIKDFIFKTFILFSQKIIAYTKLNFISLVLIYAIVHYLHYVSTLELLIEQSIGFK